MNIFKNAVSLEDQSDLFGFPPDSIDWITIQYLLTIDFDEFRLVIIANECYEMIPRMFVSIRMFQLDSMIERISC